MTKSLLLLLASLTCTLAHADDSLEFPDEELARETVLPVFAQRRVVLNRNVITERRLEIGGGAGLEMNEPYFADLMGQVMGTYNFNELHALNVQALFWQQGLSDYGDQLKAGGARFSPFDASPVPHPQFALLANYEFIAYYGKISVTKQAVMNLNLFALAGVGYLGLSNSSSTIAVNVGLGQNFFFTKHLGIRADLRMFMFQGPNPASPQDPGLKTPRTFDDRIFYNSQLSLTGIIVL